MQFVLRNSSSTLRRLRRLSLLLFRFSVWPFINEWTKKNYTHPTLLLERSNIHTTRPERRVCNVHCASCVCEECSFAELTLTSIEENTVNKLYLTCIFAVVLFIKFSSQREHMFWLAQPPLQTEPYLDEQTYFNDGISEIRNSKLNDMWHVYHVLRISRLHTDRFMCGTSYKIVLLAIIYDWRFPIAFHIFVEHLEMIEPISFEL